MRMKNKSVIITSIILLILGALSLRYAGIFAVGDFCPGKTGTVYSMGQVDYKSGGDNIFNGALWQVTLSDLPNGMCIGGDFDASQIKDTADNQKAKYGFGIDITSKPQVCNYPITEEGSVYRIDFASSGIIQVFKGQEQATIDKYKLNCKDIVLNEGGYSGIGVIVSVEKGFVYSKVNVLCPYRTNRGIIGNIRDPNLIWGVDLIFENKQTGETYSKSISSSSERSAWLKEGYVHATWGGNMIDDRWCPSPSTENVKAFRSSKTNLWQTIDSSNYNAWNSNRLSALSCLQALDLKPAITSENALSCVKTINIYADNIYKSKSFCSVQDGECAVISGNEAKITLKKNIVISQLVLRIKASILGIYQSIGKPKIISVSNVEMISDRTASTAITIQNEGSEKGAFNLWAECPSALNIQTSTYDLSLGAGEQQSKTITLSGTSAKNADYNCVAYLMEKTSGEKVSKSFSVSIKGRGTMCEPVGVQTCSSNQIYECKPNGQYELVKSCDKDICYIMGGKGECRKKAINECKSCVSWLQSKISPDKCNSKYLVDFLWIKEFSQDKMCPYAVGFVGVLIGGIAFVITFVVIRKIKKRGK